MSYRFTVCIATKDRPDSLFECLKSLEFIVDEDFEVIVVDDGSASPQRAIVCDKIDPKLLERIKFYRNETNVGYIQVRNFLAENSSSRIAIFLDDDAHLIDTSVLRAIDTIERDSSVSAVAFKQLSSDRQPYPGSMQPSVNEHPCVVPTFCGYGHAIQISVFQGLGGYREILQCYGEEKEFCKRLLNQGGMVVFDPSICVVHSHSQSGRSELKRMRFNCRNSIIDAILNEPLLMLLFSVPARVFAYWKWRKVPCKYYNIDDSGGIRWILSDVLRNLKTILKMRRPLSFSTFRKWRKLRLTPVRYG